MSEQPVGLHCPGCGQPPLWVFGESQAWCGTEECSILTWNPQKTAAELMANMKIVDLRQN